MGVDWSAVCAISVSCLSFSCSGWDEFVLGTTTAVFDGMKAILRAQAQGVHSTSDITAEEGAMKLEPRWH